MSSRFCLGAGNINPGPTRCVGRCVDCGCCIATRPAFDHAQSETLRANHRACTCVRIVTVDAHAQGVSAILQTGIPRGSDSHLDKSEWLATLILKNNERAV